MTNLKIIVAICAAFLLGLFSTHLGKLVLAHGGNLNFIHACVKTSNGSLRIIGANDTCSTGETALDWHKGTNFPPYFCIGCDLAGETRLAGKDLTNARMDAFTQINGTDFSGTTLVNANLRQIFTAQMANFSNANLTNTDFTDANLQGAVGMDTATRTGVIWSNTTCPDGTNSDNNGNTCEGHLTP
jgi:uncharacterized protein YjbI with pentapeptide repeats